MLHIGHTTFLLSVTESRAFNGTLENRPGQGVMSGDLTEAVDSSKQRLLETHLKADYIVGEVVRLSLLVEDPEVSLKASYHERLDPLLLFC